MEFTKSERKIAKVIIEKGLQNEFASGLDQFHAILNKWKTNKETISDNRDSYYNIFSAVKKFDKQIAFRYDGMRPSDFGMTILAQLSDGFITQADLSDFSDERKDQIIATFKRLQE